MIKTVEQQICSDLEDYLFFILFALFHAIIISSQPKGLLLSGTGLRFVQ